MGCFVAFHRRRLGAFCIPISCFMTSNAARNHHNLQKLREASSEGAWPDSDKVSATRTLVHGSQEKNNGLIGNRISEERLCSRTVPWPGAWLCCWHFRL